MKQVSQSLDMDRQNFSKAGPNRFRSELRRNLDGVI